MGSVDGINRRFVLAARPVGRPKESDFRLESAPIPTPKPGEVLIRAHYVSVDPLQRLRMNESARYGNTVPLGEVMIGRLVGEIVQSRNPAYREGEFVEGMLGWQEYAVSDGGTDRVAYAPGITRVDPSLAPISTSLGILGFPGMTAYFAMMEIGQPKAGETVVVSTAAGTVGSLAGQIAKIHGCRVIGIAGSDEKVAYVTGELGFEGALNYATARDLSASVKMLCPDGVDIYFDNTGGAIRDAVLPHLRLGARIPLVGRIADMHDPGQKVVPDPYVYLTHARARMEGFIVYDYAHRADEARRAIAGWLREGKLKYRETLVDGFENTPAAFIAMLGGANIGKQLVRVT